MNGEKKNRKVLLLIRTLGLLALVALAAGSLLAIAPAQYSQAHNPLPRHTPTKARFALEFAPKKSGGGQQNLVYHSGPVIHSAHVVAIYWGPSWGTGGSDSIISTHETQFFQQFGTTTHYNVITQYSDTAGPIQTTSLGNNAYYDSSTPPTNVTDADAQGEVSKAVAALGTFDPDTVYEVFLPATSYSSHGTATSCGGPNLQYCSYHSNFISNSTDDVKYAVLPYPSCGGCQQAGFATDQNFDHFAGHETREAVTDPDGTAWYDRHGNEADDKCTWNPAPFIDTDGFAYQYEWSNAASGCVK